LPSSRLSETKLGEPPLPITFQVLCETTERRLSTICGFYSITGSSGKARQFFMY
jgi:hypothetical protein